MKYILPDGILKEKHGTKEYWLQVYFADYLRGDRRVKNKLYPIKRPFPELFDEKGKQRFTCIYQNRDPREGFFLQQLGLRRGVLDLLFWAKSVFLIDMKIGNNGLDPDQKNFCGQIAEVGVETFTALTVAQGRDILINKGLHCENYAVTEPPMSKEDQQRAYLEMMIPLK